MPTNSYISNAAQTLLTEAKDAIAAGDRARALRVLDGLRYRSSDEGRQLPSAIAEALVATARGAQGVERALIARRFKDAHAALRQILEWIDSLPFDVDELAQIAAMVSQRQILMVGTKSAPEESTPANEAGMRALPFGSGWLEWRWIGKSSGRQFGPYVLYTPAQFAGGLFYRLN